MSACIPTYMLASSLIAEGMNWWQAVLTIFLGNTIVLIPMVLNAHAGTKYGIPFPIYCRASFGILGANVPGAAAGTGRLRLVRHPDLDRRRGDLQDPGHLHPGLDGAADDPGGWASTPPSWPASWRSGRSTCVVIYLGIESIRFLLNIKAPLLIALGLALLAWAYVQADGFGPMLAQPSQFDPGGPKAGQFWAFFFPALTGMIGFWATLSLNIPDFTRYARSQRDQVLGQALGLPRRWRSTRSSAWPSPRRRS